MSAAYMRLKASPYHIQHISEHDGRYFYPHPLAYTFMDISLGIHAPYPERRAQISPSLYVRLRHMQILSMNDTSMSQGSICQKSGGAGVLDAFVILMVGRRLSYSRYFLIQIVAIECVIQYAKNYRAGCADLKTIPAALMHMPGGILDMVYSHCGSRYQNTKCR